MMPVRNGEVAEKFDTMADLLAIKDANRFRIRAYRNGANTIRDLSENVGDMVDQDQDLTQLPDIGKDLANKIEEIVETGSLSALEELKGQVPGQLTELMDIDQLGPKRVKKIYQELGITSIDDLKEAAEEEEIEELEGLGEKTEDKIIKDIQRHKEEEHDRYKISIGEEYAEPLVDYLDNVDGVKKVTVAGSFRRRLETVGDLDILVLCDDPEKVMDKFVQYEDVERTVSKGDTRSTVVLDNEFHVDVRIVPEESYGAAMHYFTGSKDHNIAMRKLAKDNGWKLSEYGLFKDDDNRLAGKTEEEIYDKFNMDWIPPELRENSGEIEAAKKGQLPHLVTTDDIKGDLHVHTYRTDGKLDLETIAESAKKMGYKYLAITDHSKRVTMANGLDQDELEEQIAEIDKINEKIDDFTFLKGIEVDILKDGSLDLDEDILEKLDLVIAAVHYNRNLEKEEQTKRVLEALENEYVNILAHPLGRFIQEREPLELDLNQIMEKAKEEGCFLELNAHPKRLDLSDTNCKLAKEKGVKVVISTDTHKKSHFDNIRYGVDQARRGWLEPEDVLNTRSLDQLLELLEVE